MRATTASISAGPIRLARAFFGRSFCAAPASSTTSRALSGSRRSGRCLEASRTAASRAASV